MSFDHIPSSASAAPLGRRRFLRFGASGVGLLAGAKILAACGSDDDKTSSTTSAATTPGSVVDSAVPTTAGSAATTVESSATTAAATTGELKHVRVGLAWIQNFEYSGTFIGRENGFYEEAGIDIEFVSGGPNAPDTLVSLAAGDVDIADVAGLSNLVDAVGKGNDFVAIAAQYQIPPGGVLSLKAKPVLKPADLVGIKFLGQDGVDQALDAVFKINGLEKDYEFIKASYTPDPLLEGQGEAYSCYVFNQPIALEAQGLVAGTDYFTVTWAELGLPSYGDLFVTTRKYLEENREAVAAFMTGTIKGWETNKLDPKVGPQLAVDKYGADLGLVLDNEIRSNELQIPLLESDFTKAHGMFRIDVDALGGPMYDALIAAGRTGLPDVNTIVDLTLLDDVFGDKTTLI